MLDASINFSSSFDLALDITNELLRQELPQTIIKVFICHDTVQVPQESHREWYQAICVPNKNNI